MTSARIELGVDSAGVGRGLANAQREFDRFSTGIKSQVSSATIAIAGIAAAVASAYAVINRNVEAIAAIKGLSEQMGDTAESVASLRLASDVSGVSMDKVSAASVKLTASLSKVDEEGQTTQKAIERLGLKFQDFVRLSPVEQLDAVAKAMASFEDGAGKTAVAVALFGRSGAELIPFLNDLANGSERQVTLTQKQIEAADNFSKALARMKSEAATAIQVLVADFIPAIQSVLDEFVEGRRRANGFIDALLTFGTINPFKSQQANIASYREELDDLAAARKRYVAAGSDTRAIDDAIAQAQKKLGYLQALERNAIARDLAGTDTGDAISRRNKPRTLSALGLADDKKGSSADPLAKAKAYLDTLDKQAIAVQKLTTYEQALLEIQSGRLGKGAAVPKALQERILAAAKVVDAEKRIEKERDLAAEAAKDRQAARNKEYADAEAFLRETSAAQEKANADARAQLYEATRSPLERLNAEQARLQELLDKGIISWDLYARAMMQASETYDSQAEKIEKNKGLFDEFGLAASSAFEDAILQGKKFSVVLNGLAQDIARIILRKKVTEPIGNALAEAVGGLGKDSGGGGGGLGSIFRGIFGGGRASGGPVGAGGLYQVNENGPELLTTGGRDYLLMGNRPGQITPNNAIGAGAGQGVTITIDARGAEVGAADRLRAAAADIQAQVLAAVQARANRGGSFARSLGRA